MTRPGSGKPKAASRPALKNPLRASTMPLLASASASPGIGGTPAPHLANDWLASGGSEGDLMRLMGRQDRSMVDRYAADMQDQRAFDAKRRRGDMY